MKNETMFHSNFFTISVEITMPEYYNEYKGELNVSISPNLNEIDDNKVSNFLNKIRAFADFTGAQMNVCSIVDLSIYNIKNDELTVYKKLLINLSKSLLKDLS